MYSFPIKYFESKLIFNSNKRECYAVYRINGYNYDFRSDESKIKILNRFARFIANMGTEAKILIIPVSQDIDNHYSRILKKMNAKNPLYSAARGHAEGTSAWLKNKLKISNNVNDYRAYVVTKLSLSNNALNDIKEALTYLIKSPMRTIQEFLGVDYRDILQREFEAFSNLADDYLKRQDKRVSITPTDEYELQWLLRRPFFRGLGDFKLRVNKDKDDEFALPWTPFSERIIKDGEVAVRANSREVLTLTDGLVDISEPRVLKVHHGDDRVSYQSFLAVAHIPDGIIYPGNEWLLALQDYEIQTEVCISINTVEHKDSIRNIGRKKREIDDQIQHTTENNEEIPDELLDSKELARELEAELRNSKAPIANTSIYFCFFSDDRKELENSITLIKEIYEDNDFVIERPMSDQLKLFMEFIPGTGRYVTDYIQPLPPRTLAGGVIGATRLLGDNLGQYIGTTGILEKNVYLDISRACRLNRSASAAFLGTLGGGKSFNANLLFYLSVLYGGFGLVLDPKGERTNWARDLPEFEGQINIITLSADYEDKGKLDPFLIYKNNMEEAGYLAISILAELFKLNPKDDEYLVVMEAIDWVKKQERPCMVKLAERLLNWPETDEFRPVAIRVGRRIVQMRNMAMAGLLFGDGTEQGLNFENRINVLQIQNLCLPKPDTPKEDYTPEEVLSTVLMLPIASFARTFMHMDRRVFKVVLFDEAWALSCTSQGLKMMDALIREGRALYAACFFIGHSVRDMRGEGIKNNVSYKFCFKATDNEEVKRVLEFMDLEVTDDNINEVKNLRNGQCLFQDLEGRVGKLQFDAVFEHLKKAFDTTPSEDGDSVDKSA